MNLENEIFIEINLPELKDKYSISSNGVVYNKRSKKFSTGTVDNHGYLSVKLRNINKEYKKYLIHRLVALSWKSDTYFKDAKVNHIDENKLNNHINNLEWVTHAENLEKYRSNNKGIIGVKKLTEKEVLNCRKLYKNGTSIWDIWEKFLNKRINYSAVLYMLKYKTYKNVA